MALTIVGVQQARQVLSDVWMDSALLIPGTSDYVTGGYSIPAVQLSGAKTIQAAWVSGTTLATVSTVDTNGVIGVPLLALAQVGSGGPGFTGYSTLLFYCYVVTTGVQVGSGGNLTGATWQITYLFN